MSDSEVYPTREVSLVRQVGEVLRQANAMMERIRGGEEIPLEEQITYQRFKVNVLRRIIDQTPPHHLTDEGEVLLQAEQERQRLQLQAGAHGE